MDTVDGLRLFIRVVKTGSFSKASAGLGINQSTATQPTATQPMATQHVAALEAQLGARYLGTNLSALLAAARGWWAA